MKKLLFLIFSLFLLFSKSQVFAQAEKVSKIKIVSTWQGFEKSSKDTLKIIRKKRGFVSKGKIIKTELINNLLNEVENKDKPILADFGITPHWLNVNADKVTQFELKNSTKNAKKYFAESFRNYEKIKEVFPETVERIWFDNEPSFEMTIYKSDGSKIKITSYEPKVFMVPWRIEKDKNKYLNPNPNLSRAISALLPENFTNRRRINGDYLLSEIAERLHFLLGDELKLLESEDLIGKELNLLRKNNYEIIKSVINTMGSVDIDSNGLSWNAKIRRKDLPKNVFVGVSIPYEDKKLTTLNIFIEKIDSIIKQTLSVPWLNQYINQNSKTKFEIRFVINRSFSKKAEESFIEDMKEGNAENFLSKFKSNLSESVFLEISENRLYSRWLILPNKNMILWHYTNNKVLNWDLSNTRKWGESHKVSTITISPFGQLTNY